ncbi:MAG: hypothetical protein A3G25_16470 [Betaproteobacteria bacterium RIFCSPLOWO2_12_FULL_63_13]|nr:MAG: hypothetical protein A3H32_20010 [Betaproteobacteria bacterium RIFCSPLOWO2_02_FULL_63_19]OGA47572.1 MAG: hypothetical protein A3G25_16470 [Betaproteobacteria bacterium RIFCSPLOWO2_12_FULL_63_13]
MKPIYGDAVAHGLLQTASLMLLLIAFLGACAHVSGDDGAARVVDARTAHRLSQRNWDLKGLTVDGRQIVIDVDTVITIRFSPDGQVAGFAAVNRYSGTYSLSGSGKLNWGRIPTVVTGNIGLPELMEKQRAYLRALVQTDAAVLAGRVLVLQSVDATTVLTFNEAGF